MKRKYKGIGNLAPKMNKAVLEDLILSSLSRLAKLLVGEQR
jgi:hypothetical protein